MGNQYISSHISPVRRIENPDRLTIIILAANIGYGMKSYGPKSLLNINETETVLEYQINMLKTCFPKSDIILTVGFFANKIIRKCPQGVRIVENQLYQTTNETEQLRLALNCTITNNIMILTDSLIFNYETIIYLDQNKSYIIYDSKNQINPNNIGITLVDNKATFFNHESTNKWCHIIHLTKRETLALKQLCNNKDNSKLFLFELLNELLLKTKSIDAIEPDSMRIVKIDNSRNLQKIQNG